MNSSVSKSNEEIPIKQETHYNEEEDEFYIYKRIEISKLSNRIFPKGVYFLIVLFMILYLYINLISSAIITSTSLNHIIIETTNYTDHKQYYIIILSGFYGLVVLMSLYNINKLKKFSIVITILRCLILIFIISCLGYSISKYGHADYNTDIPKFNISNITVMIGNSLYLFMSHHSMPGMVQNFKPQKSLFKLITISYIVSLIILIFYGYVSLLAFGNQIYCNIKEFPSAINVYLYFIFRIFLV
jgi:amino acid transporter